jgi:hypothetical protein
MRMASTKKRNWIDKLLGDDKQTEVKRKPDEVITQPALRQLGITECPVCGREVAVFITRNRRPYTNCGCCLARIFFNGSESMRLLRKKMRPVEE